MTRLKVQVTPTSLSYKVRFVILAELQNRGISRAELAGRAGVDPKHLSQLINGRAAMSLDVADQLLRALGREWTIGTVAAYNEPTMENWKLIDRPPARRH